VSRAAPRALIVLGGLLVSSNRLAAQAVQGQVTDAASRRPIAGVVRLLDESGADAARATLVMDGRFSLQAPTPGRYRIRLESPGYQVAVSSSLDLAAGLTLVMNVEVRALTPTMLDTIVVVGAPVPYRLLDFHDRRAKGFGEFITRQEFEPLYPNQVTDVLRRMRGLRVRANPNYGRMNPFTGFLDTREYLIVSNRIPEIQVTVCAALIFVDGAYVGNTGTVDVDDVLDVEFIDAIEAYSGAGNLPAQFNREGSDCGVIVAWSRASPATGPALSNHLDLGGQFGARVSGRGLEDGRIGVQAAVTLAGFLELYPAVNLLLGLSTGDASSNRTGWQVLASLRVRPLGKGSAWYVGAGYTALDLQVSQNSSFSPSEEEGHPLLLTGASLLGSGSVRPFVELQVLDPFWRGALQIHAFAGLSLRTY